ncbi:hypothetical protein GCM10018980_51050 [Streptomyces capoamus]|uniref:Uncharacterized protein n=1 Tax=Streptomyces capoamus TaxID=68183 RepID=A0A919EZ45_9ACTN|nr:hypothetical protein [Streptomyces capoamus]GGW15888.1 hypothetical protein GCM10010501_29760 [Streptomyces libani subsp. rufus]GHG61705.1 hypothetical protein GCM10018980_51050 [Streptomyces capoamus]
MKRHLPAVLVAGWGVLNGLLLVVLAVYRENSMTYWLWGGVVLVVELAALAVLVSSRAGTDQHVRYRVRDRGAGGVLPAAIGLLLVALCPVYGLWLLVVAVPLLMLSVALAVHGTTARER